MTPFRTVLLLLATAALQDPPAVRPGLVGEYYVIGEEYDDFPTLRDRKPAVRRIDPRIGFARTSRAWPGTDLADFFCVRWTGLLRVPGDGKYAFALASDDGSRLFIDGRLVVNNGGLHGYEEAEGRVELKAGDHAIRVDFFEGGGEAGCVLSWTPPGGDKETVPTTALFHARDAELDRK